MTDTLSKKVPPTMRDKHRPRSEDIPQRFGVFAAVVVLFSVLPSTRDIFPTRVNWVAILGNQMVGLFIALAVVIPLTAEILALSVGATAGAASLTTAAAMSRWELPLLAAAVLCLAMGAAIGVLNGWIVTRFSR